MNRPVSDPGENARPRRRLRRILTRLGAAVFLLVLIGELTARYAIGLGDPPLFMSDPDLLYIAQPSKTYARMHHRIYYNAYSMRSEDFPRRKTTPDELRVMVVGDSVVSGTSIVGNDDLATTLLQKRLTAQLGRPVVVGNMACGGWGPGNELAYARRYGFFDADVVVVVMSSHDYADRSIVSPVDIDPNFPSHRPISALTEALTRYVPRYLPHFSHGAESASRLPAARDANDPAIASCLNSERDLLRSARASGAEVLFVQHLERVELDGQLKPGHDLLLAVARSEGVTDVQLGPSERAARDAGRKTYGDDIHQTADGYAVMADALIGPMEDALRARLLRPAGRPTTSGS